jgi:hypothetical protein
MAKKPGGIRKSATGRTRRKAPRATPKPDTTQVTSEEALAFIRALQERFSKAPRTRAEKAALQEYLSGFDDRLLKAVGSRVESDLMLRPAKTIGPEDVTTQRAESASRRKRT